MRQRIWRLGFTADDVATVILDHARRIQADSLFLPAVTHTGIRLPLPMILKSTSSELSNLHTIIDASQAYGHINTSDWTHLADFTFGGCHKWVRAYLPLGVGFAREPQSLHFVRGNSADPLLQFCDSNRSGHGPMETVNLTPLLTAHGAVMDLIPSFKECRFASEALELKTHSRRCPAWPVLSRHHTLSSNIVLLQSASLHFRDLPNQQLREMLAHHGIAATKYGNGVIRISVPHVTQGGLSNITNPLAVRLICLKYSQKPTLLAFCGHGPESNTLAPIESPRLARES